MRAAPWDVSHGTQWCTRTLGIAAVMVSLSAGCRDSIRPTEPEPAQPAAPPTDPSARPDPFPQPARPARVYRGDDSIYAPFDFNHQGRLASRYVLYEDDTFGLEFFSPRFGLFEYAGKYASADSLITFAFDAWSTAGPWEATGILRGDSLIVEYNDVMMWSDFMDGTYVRSAATP